VNPSTKEMVISKELRRLSGTTSYSTAILELPRPGTIEESSLPLDPHSLAHSQMSTLGLLLSLYLKL